MANVVINVVLLLTILTTIQSQHMLEEQLESYHRCRYDSDCKPNAYCYGNNDTYPGRCACKAGYELNRNATFYECLKPQQLDGACEKDFQCQLTAGPLAICNRYKICECNPTIAHKYTDGLCYKTANLTGLCLSDPNCKLSDGTFRFCVFGHCACGMNEVPSKDLQSCVLAKRLGDRCTNDNECMALDSNTICDKVCICNMGHVLARNAKRCLKAASAFGDPCQEDEQCMDYLYESVCVSGNCSCGSNYHPHGVSCVKSVRLGGECFETVECEYERRLEGSVECTKNVCQCIYGESGDSCKLKNASNINRVYFKQILPLLMIVLIINKLLYN